jgi:hypothetical protein
MTEDAAVAADPPPLADAADAAPAPEVKPSQTLDDWEHAQRQWAVLLRQNAPDAAWLVQFEAAAERLRLLARRDPDAALYVLLQAAADNLGRYGTHHALLCAVVCDLCAQGQSWPADEVDALWRAALAMNLALTVMQDSLARQIGPLSAAQREQVDTHAEAGARLLAEAGVSDALWLELVRRHHERGDAAAASPADRLVGLLNRVDIYTAKLSRRATREPTSPAIAARDACLDAERRPDAIGGALLRTLGLYPPGCFVQLASGEVGVVIRRGAKAHTPVVAALRRQDGGLYLQPLRRDTALARYAITRGVNATAVRVHMNHPRTLAA